MLIYVDLDETLITSTVDDVGTVTQIFVRPWAREFLVRLAKRGEVSLLSMGSRRHVGNGLQALYPESQVFRSVLTREDLAPVEMKVDKIFEKPYLSPEQALSMWENIQPIAPRGVMLDDQGMDSQVFAVKAAALGIDWDSWIKVPAYEKPDPDDSGLKRAYGEFLRRFPGIPTLGAARVMARWA